jgi:hypothetical protein
VQAGLVERHQEWPGLLLWADKDAPKSQPFRIFDQRREKARRATRPDGPKVSPLDFYIEETLTVQPLSLASDGEVCGMAAGVVAEVRRQEGKLREERLKGRKGVLGPAGVLAQDPEGAPAQPKRGWRPLCHTSCRREDDRGRSRPLRAGARADRASGR